MDLHRPPSGNRVERILFDHVVSPSVPLASRTIFIVSLRYIAKDTSSLTSIGKIYKEYNPRRENQESANS